jgi:hypothetical protein
MISAKEMVGLLFWNVAKKGSIFQQKGNGIFE